MRKEIGPERSTLMRLVRSSSKPYSLGTQRHYTGGLLSCN